MDFQIDKIYNEDCLEGMKRIPDGMVDCIITDLPYGVLNRSNPDSQWDNVIPFEPMWEQFKRVTKENAAIVLFAQGMFTSDLMQSNRKMWRYNLVWDKVTRPTGFLNANNRPLRIHEDILIFYEKQPTYNPQFTKGEFNHNRGCKGTYTNRTYGTFSAVNTELTTDKHPRSIISIDKVSAEIVHPTQKPVDLLRYLILTYTNVGG